MDACGEKELKYVDFLKNQYMHYFSKCKSFLINPKRMVEGLDQAY